MTLSFKGKEMILMRNMYRLLPTLNARCLTQNIKQTSGYSTASPIKEMIIEPMTDRHIIRVKGDEVVPFLQGLITNDIKHLHPSSNKSIYAMFLNKAGRVLYDTIVYSTNDPNTILIECDKNVANDLSRHLRLYRVRRNIDIDSIDEELKVWQVFNADQEVFTNEVVKMTDNSDVTVTTDPRLNVLGYRLLAKANKTWSDLSNLFGQKREIKPTVSGDNNFRLLRYRLGVAEGVVDMPPGKCFPLEANCDLLNGVSFHKGCYIGQELTARVHHTGMIRKRHMPVRLLKPLATDAASFTVQNEAGANCGTLLGITGERALGLLRIENVLKAKELLVHGTPCETEKPLWWPQDLHANISIRKEL